MEEGSFESSNINTLWIKNVYENIENIEKMLRLAKQGCSNIVEYTNLSHEQVRIKLSDIQYTNLSFIVTELLLLLDDLIPIIGQENTTKYIDKLEDIEKSLRIKDNKKLFINEQYSDAKKNIINSNVTEFFYSTLDIIIKIKRKIIIDISPILFIPKNKTPDDYIKTIIT